MTTDELVNSITSREISQVRNSACEIINSSQNTEIIFPLINHLNEIIEKTKNLDLGGAFAPNIRFAEYAIRIIEFHKNNTNCSCELYLDKYECNDPKKETEKGNIKIENTVKIDNNWIDYYLSKCSKCGQEFKIFEREYHYTWWEWHKI